jgi:membrane protein YdbS with pleckstrin-like domain
MSVDAPDETPDWLNLDPNEEIQWWAGPALPSVADRLAIGIITIPLLGLGLLILAQTLLYLKSTDYVVTNQSLYVKDGILHTNVESIDLDKIQNTNFTQRFMGKQLNFGTIEFSTAGSTGFELAFENIADARTVEDRISQLASGHSDDDPSTDEAPVEELLELLIEELQATRAALESIDSRPRTNDVDAGQIDLGNDPDESASGTEEAE